MLTRDSTKVVKAKAHNPKGAGLANFLCSVGLYRPGWNSPPKAGRRAESVVLACARGFPKWVPLTSCTACCFSKTGSVVVVVAIVVEGCELRNMLPEK